MNFKLIGFHYFIIQIQKIIQIRIKSKIHYFEEPSASASARKHDGDNLCYFNWYSTPWSQPQRSLIETGNWNLYFWLFFLYSSISSSYSYLIFDTSVIWIASLCEFRYPHPLQQRDRGRVLKTVQSICLSVCMSALNVRAVKHRASMVAACFVIMWQNALSLNVSSRRRCTAMN